MRNAPTEIQNDRSPKRVHSRKLGAFNVFVEASGPGKTTLFDMFGLPCDARVHNVRRALAKRGGFRKVPRRRACGPILLERKFREHEGPPPVTYAERAGQALVSSHSRGFLNALNLDKIYRLEKNAGFTTLRHASDDQQRAALLNEGDRPRMRWRQGLFGTAQP